MEQVSQVLGRYYPKGRWEGHRIFSDARGCGAGAGCWDVCLNLGQWMEAALEEAEGAQEGPLACWV